MAGYGGSGGLSGTGVAAQVPYFDGATSVKGKTTFTFDETNDALTVGVARFHSTGTSNTFAGENAGNFTLSGTLNTGMGKSTLVALTSGDYNSAFGVNALTSNTEGSNNSSFGGDSLKFNTTGTDGSAFGALALAANTMGGNNSAFGVSALQSNTTGNYNSAFGHGALASNTGSSSVAVGRSAGAALTTGGTCTFLGATSNTTLVTAVNSTVIGFGASVDASNTIVLGNASVVLVRPATTSAADLGSPSAIWANFHFNVSIFRSNVKVIGVQGAAVADASGGVVIDVEARTQLNLLLGRVRAATGHGLIA